MARSLESELTDLRARVRVLEQVIYGLQSRQGKATPGERFLDVELDDDLEPEGSVICNVMDWNGTTEVDSGANVTAYDRGYQLNGVAGNKGLLRWSWVKQRWEFVQLECDDAAEDVRADTVEGEIESEFLVGD